MYATGMGLEVNKVKCLEELASSRVNKYVYIFIIQWIHRGMYGWIECKLHEDRISVSVLFPKA